MREPLFILTPNRSLTSMARAMIGNHPDMAGLAETNLFVAETCEEVERLYLLDDRFQHGLLRTIAEYGLGEQTEDNIEVARAWLAENQALTTCDLFKDILAMVDPRRVVDGSIVYVYRAGVVERITREFPEASYLHLAMHPRLTCELAYKTRKVAAETRLGRAIASDKRMQPNTIWLRPHLRILQAMENVPVAQKMFLRGEQVLADPEKYLARICDWLGIASDADSIDAMMRPEESPFARYGPENASLGNDPHFLESPRLLPHEEQAGDMDSPLSWDPDLFLDDNLKQLARALGY